MRENNHEPQSERQLTPEEQLDLLLEQFLNDPDDSFFASTPVEKDEEGELVQDAAKENSDIDISEEDHSADSPEHQLDLLLASFMAEIEQNVVIEPVVEEEPVEEMVPLFAEGEAPVEEEPVIEEEPVDEIAPLFAEEEAPVEEEPSIEEAPVEEMAPLFAEEEAPVEEEPVIEEAPVEEIAPLFTEETPVEEEPVIEEEPTQEENEEPQSVIDPSILEVPMNITPAEEESKSEEASGNVGELMNYLSQQEADASKKKLAPRKRASAPREHKPFYRPKYEPLPEEEPEEEEYVGFMPDVPDPPKKRRPRNTKAYGFLGIPHMLTTLVWLGIVVFIGVGLGKFIWNCAADILALGYTDSQVAITIDESDTLEDIADKLHKTGLIRYPSLFVIYGNISEAMDSIKSGSYTLNTIYDYHALVDAMSSYQSRITTNVTIPEGYTTAQIFALLESKGVSTVAKLEDAAANKDLGNYWFLEGVERGSANCLEGFLFPDTYTFYLDHDPVSVLQKFLNNFNKRFNESMKIKLDTLNMTLAERMRANGLDEEYIAAHQMTVRDVVIVASLIEKETSSNLESYNISSVIYNRLTKPNEYPYLQIDAALIYYTGRAEITAEDLATDHPYNTYTRPGLSIAGPISNPGSYSLDAALDPAESDYHFYALDPSTGTHHFSKTLKEHNDFLASLRKEEEEE